MAVDLRVGDATDLLGSADFVHAFFATVAARAEGGHWGSHYAAVMNDLYSGVLPASQVAAARTELEEIEQELARFPPSDVVWDAERPNARPAVG